MKNVRGTNEKGITLIALIVTIIILIILAGVSISMLTGENGILRKATDAKKETEQGIEKEQLKIAMASLNFENSTDLMERKEKFIEYLENKNTDVHINNKGYTVYYKESNRIYTIDENGNIQQEDIDILEKDKTPGEFDGEGTESDPYVIMSIEDLINWSKYYSKYNKCYIKLGKNLDFKSELSYCNIECKDFNDFLECEQNDIGLMNVLGTEEYKGFKAIENFEGEFNGNGYTIKNLYQNTIKDTGFFITFRGIIENLTITGKIYSTNNIGGFVVEAIAQNGKILNCNSYIDCYSENGMGGGFIARSGCEIENCTNYGNISGKGCVGGILGSNSKNTTNCKNYGDIVGESTIGGIIGRYGNCTNCINYGNITASINIAGGIIGQLNSRDIIDCINYGTIKSPQNAGGIFGIGSAKITNCINEGIVMNK